MRKTILLILAVFVSVISALAIDKSFPQIDEHLSPVKLRCENIDNPTVVDVLRPRLSWVNKTTANGQVQTFYEIEVASSKELLTKGKTDLWKSGKVESEQSVYIPYAGVPLKSGMDCWWRVRVWDKCGVVSEWSEVAYWGMGILSPEEWQAEWIGGGNLLKKEFVLKKKLKQAKIFITGLGFFELYANGSKIGDDLLTPHETSYGHRDSLNHIFIPIDGDNFRSYRVNYLRYDLTQQLKKGNNKLEILLGNGMYNADHKRWIKSYGPIKAICRLELHYKDGTKDVVVTDGTWDAAQSQIVHDNVYTGEIYDARIEPSWYKAQILEAPDGKLYAQMSPSDKLMELKRPIAKEKLEDGSIAFDFDEYITGWVRIKNIKEARGTELSIDYQYEEDWPDPMNGISKYICSGSGSEEYAPRFTWFAFNRVVISGLTNDTSPEDIIAEVVYSDIQKNGHFECSNELINRINTIYLRAQTNNMHLGVPTDCPHREKAPYTGDGQVSCTSAMHNFDLLPFYRTWIKDMVDVQNVKTGYVPNSAPWHQGAGGGAGWGAAMNVIPWETYLMYGDIKLLEDNYFYMTEQLRYMNSCETAEGIMEMKIPGLSGEPEYWMNLGEWVWPFDAPEDRQAHTYLYWLCHDYTSRTAEVLGKVEDAKKFREKADEIAATFHKVFYRDGSYGLNGGNIFALVMGVPEKENTLESVKASILAELELRDGHMFTGIFGTRFFFEILSEIGLGEYAYRSMTKRTIPSFGYWVEQGATTFWEYWNGFASHNHPMFGGGLNWLYRNLAGVRYDEKEPAYKHIIIKPEVYDDLDWCKYRTESIYGTVSSEWKRENGTITMRVQIPVGSHATVHTPDGKTHNLPSGEYLLQ